MSTLDAAASTAGLVPPQEVLADFFSNANIPLHIVDAGGIILHANHAELALLGYAAEDYIGQPIARFHADQDAIEDIVTRLASGEAIRAYPAMLRTRDGGIRHVEITSSPHFEDGRFVNTRCFSIDVTELVEARGEIRRRDQQMQDILDALPAAIYTTDKAGLITYFNRAAVELAGREPTIGVDEWCVTYKLFTADGEPLPHDQCPMAVALRENRPVRGVEAMAQRPDGTMVPFVPFPTPLRNEQGELTGAINMLVDISERKTAEANQRLLLRELNHRVKNNMHMLHGLLRMASREGQSPEARDVLDGIAGRVAAMASAQQILYRERQPRSFDSTGFIEAVVASARQAFPASVSVRIEGDDVELDNDAAMPLALIINELMTNAVKHGLRSPEAGEITVSLAGGVGGSVTLVVSDDGRGFAVHKGSRRTSGLGLVEGLARQLGGSFAVEPGTSRCVVSFPNHIRS